MMFSIWEELRKSPDLRHCLCIPCDSHGIQLLVKDILAVSSLKAILSQAQSIVKAFKKSPLQYARLRNFQIAVYSKQEALCLSVITRWGTQFGLMNSVYKNMEALRRYAYDFAPKELGYNAHDIISNEVLDGVFVIA